jgi:hypothetical protein
LNRTTSTWWILKNDYFSMLMLIGAVVPWVVVAVGAAGLLRSSRGDKIPAEMAYYGAAVTTVVTLALVPLAFWRVASIKRVIQNGAVCTGHITYIDFHRDRGRVDYTYQFAGQTYQSGNGIWKNANTQDLYEGEDIEVIVDPDKPETAYLAKLYVERDSG